MEEFNCSSTMDTPVDPLVQFSSFFFEGIGIPFIGGFGIIGNIVTCFVLR